MLKYIFAILITLGAVACTTEKKVTLQYDQTWCTDKWGYGQTDEETVTKLKTYLLSKGITVGNINFTIAPQDYMACKACYCPSGRKFVITINKSDADKLKAEGFHE